MNDPWNIHKISSSISNSQSFQLHIQGHEFIPTSIHVFFPSGARKVLKNRKELGAFYLGQDMLDAAVMSAYYADISCFSIVVQRIGKDIQIIHVEEKKETRTCVNGNLSNNTSLIGADLEVMARRKNGPFISFPLGNGYDNKIGADRALIRQGTSFSQPIIELRADPKKSGKELHEEFMFLKKELESRADKNNLLIVSEENPTGRFFLGGHFHVSNATPTYRKISLLDSLLTLPIASITKLKKPDRRSLYGKLGAVRLNRFKGFEYRSLPSWYHFIEGGEPFFTWVETLLFNSGLPKINLAERTIHAYYEGDHSTLKEEVYQLFTYARNFLTKKEEVNMENWIIWLEKNEEID
ncbi:hypothetical protein ACERII_11900 [Evansella sp. AB-rgal1]|uniref:putative amidoligase domain-containing protein n=1 Tax=Evansella sp. AB-rgal1 TaxID=3242696 RepID=UPI00359CE7DB